MPFAEFCSPELARCGGRQASIRHSTCSHRKRRTRENVLVLSRYSPPAYGSAPVALSPARSRAHVSLQSGTPRLQCLRPSLAVPRAVRDLVSRAGRRRRLSPRSNKRYLHLDGDSPLAGKSACEAQRVRGPHTLNRGSYTDRFSPGPPQKGASHVVTPGFTTTLVSALMKHCMERKLSTMNGHAEGIRKGTGSPASPHQSTASRKGPHGEVEVQEDVNATDPA